MKTVETLKKSMDLLTLALTNHNHHWTNEEREAYKNAMEVLNKNCWLVIEEYIEIFNNLKKEV